MARGKFELKSGKHVFYANFEGNAGSHAWIGIGTDFTAKKLSINAKKDTLCGMLSIIV